MNVAYQALTLVFPLITVPWVSRALGADGIGTYSYTYSIAYMFMLAGMLGINNYGNRAIARVRDDEEALSREFSAIYALQISVNLVAIFAYLCFILLAGTGYGVIDWIQLIYVLSIAFDVNWFFFGLEKFRLTITRNLIIKVLSLVLIVLLVRGTGDLWLYCLIMAGSTFLSQLFLFVLLHRYVRFTRPRAHDVFGRFKDVAVLFIPVASYSVYRVLDKTMLGAMSSVTELGYFENAEKLINIPIAVITALGTVMLPRMSYLLADSKADYRKTIRESMNLALMLACAMSLGLMVIADDICPVFFGFGFERCSLIVRLLAVTVIFSAWSNVVRTQYLIPKGRDVVYVASSVGAAVVNLALNLALIPRLGATGACFGTIAAELFIVVYQTIATKNELDTSKYFKILLTHLIKSVIMATAALAAVLLVEGPAMKLFVEIGVFIVAFLILNNRYIMREFLGL